jgi:hypothetical protein
MKFSTMSHSSCLCPILFANNTFIAMVLIFDKMVSFIDILFGLIWNVTTYTCPHITFVLLHIDDTYNYHLTKIDWTIYKKDWLVVT